MIPVITLDDAKHHLRISGDDDDHMITVMMGTACQHVLDWLDRRIDDPALYLGGVYDPVNPAAATVNLPIRHAILLVLGDLYANREAQQDGPIQPNPAFERLLNPYRRLGV